jgi:hypothetical protein
MANQALVNAVKNIITLAKNGQIDEAYQAYEALFAGREFTTYRPEEQRQALRLMVLAKGIKPTDAVIAAHRAAVPSLTALVAAHNDPGDYEMLGVCHVLLGDEARASEVFRAGLALERVENAQSDLCGRLMTRISQL